MEQRMPVTVGLEGISVVRSYLEAARTRDVFKLGAGFDNDVVWHQPGDSSISGTYRGRVKLFGLFLELNSLSKGTFRIDSVGDIMANGDLVTAIIHYSAKGDGGGISTVGVDLFRVEGGKITEVWPFSPDQDAEDRFWDRLTAKEKNTS